MFSFPLGNFHVQLFLPMHSQQPLAVLPRQAAPGVSRPFPAKPSLSQPDHSWVTSLQLGQMQSTSVIIQSKYKVIDAKI